MAPSSRGLLVQLLLLLLCGCLSLFSVSAEPQDPPPATPAPSSPRLIGVPSLFRGGDKPLDTSEDDQHTFFVSVAAFRDPECQQLVIECFNHALNPRRIVLGIIEQNEPGDSICIPNSFFRCRSSAFCPIDNIRRRRVASRRGKGPTYGRYVSMLMYRGERFYMMIDSHTGFIRNWDRRGILHLKRAHSPRPALSHYPHKWIKLQQPSTSGASGGGPPPINVQMWSRESQATTACMCNGRYLEHGFIRLVGSMMPARIEPYGPVPFAAAGFLLADARLVHLVPFDPLLAFLFDGEEVLYSTRMYTSGFDIFASGESIVFHSYGRTNYSSIKFHSVQSSLENTTMYREVYWARQRVKYFLQVTMTNRTTQVVPRNISVGRVIWAQERYGLGRVRSLDSYNRFALIDPIRRIAGSRFCDVLWRKNKKI